VLPETTNVQFGKPSVVVAPPIPPGGLTLAPPGIGNPIVAPTSAPVPSAPPGATIGGCPGASPFAVAKYSATSLISKPPLPGKYVFRNVGTYTATGATPLSLPYPTTATERVKDIKKGKNGEFSFEIVNHLGAIVATTGYAYRPPSTLTEGLTSTSPLAGLFITKVLQKNGKTVIDNFKPLGLGLQLLAVPAAPSTTFLATAVDPTSGATMIANVTEGQPVEVNACGKLVAAYPVKVDGDIQVGETVLGTHVSLPLPGPKLPGAINEELGDKTLTTFTATYDIAPQYGGIPVMSKVSETGLEAGSGVNSKMTSTINSLPLR
jgi:hypothetical protein